MAIIPCRECTHQVSDQAVSCPSCGARPHGKRGVLPRVLIALMALWTFGTVLWLLVPRSVSDQLLTRAKSSLQRLDEGIGPLHAADGSRSPRETQSVAPRQPVTEQRPASALSVSSPPAPPPRAVYHATAEQLYRDYAANAVATQTKIGDSRVRVSGSVAEIDQDATGRPLVKLGTGTTESSAAAMTLEEDQRSAAAQLAKGEVVEIECDKLVRGGTLLQGSDCTLATIDAPAAIDFRPSSAAVVRTTHRRRKHPSSPANMTTLVSTLAPVSMGPNANDAAAGDDGLDSTAARPVAAAVTDAAAAPIPAAALTPPSAPVEASKTASATLAGEHLETNNIRLASVGNSDTGTVVARAPPQDSTVVHPAPGQNNASPTPRVESSGATAGGLTTTQDDLTPVRAVDPVAADHIASYCAQIARSANGDTFAADCRHNEAAAWTRLVLQNEFPTLDDATRKRCKEPPFPDTYVAKETCARYVLRMQ